MNLFGGIAGFCDYTDNYDYVISISFNRGTISGKEYVGGLCGGAWDTSWTEDSENVNLVMIATIYNRGNVTMTDTESSNNGGILGGTLYSAVNERISGANKVSYGYNTGVISSNSSYINQVSPYYLTDTNVSVNAMYYINTNTTDSSRYGKAVYKLHLISNNSYSVYPVLNRLSGNGIWNCYDALKYIDFVWESEM